MIFQVMRNECSEMVCDGLLACPCLSNDDALTNVVTKSTNDSLQNQSHEIAVSDQDCSSPPSVSGAKFVVLLLVFFAWYGNTCIKYIIVIVIVAYG